MIIHGYCIQTSGVGTGGGGGGGGGALDCRFSQHSFIHYFIYFFFPLRV